MDPSSSQGSGHVAEPVIDDMIGRFGGIGRNNYEGCFREAKIVIFHLHATGFSEPRQICQISASYNKEIITQYILPEKDIEEIATRQCGLEIKQIGGERKLYCKGSEVDSLGPREGLANFLDLLIENIGRNIILAAHNWSGYIGKIIVLELQKHELIDTFKSIVVGYVDTLQIFRSLLEQRMLEEKSFALEDLSTDYNITIEPYVNVLTLDLLITKIGCTYEIMKPCAKDLTKYINFRLNLDSLDKAPLNKDVSKTMLQKIAKAEISMDMLKNAYKKGGEKGVEMLLKENVEKKPRVTNRAKIIKKIVAALQDTQ